MQEKYQNYKAKAFLQYPAIESMTLQMQKEIKAPPNTDSNSGSSLLGCFGPSSKSVSKSGSSGQQFSSNKSKTKKGKQLWSKVQDLNKIIEMNLSGHESFLD